MKMRSLSLLTLAFVAALAGCASGGAQINSRATMEGGAKVKRLFIFYNAKSPHFTGSLYTSFITTTQRRIESCGVNVTTLEFDALELDMRKKVTDAIEQANPDAVLLLVRNGGNLVTGSGGVSGNLYFDSEATDKQRAKSLWKARIDYRMLTQNMFANDTQSGERFAAQFVSRLATDQFITGCPADVVTLPKQ
jgi:hypothetical protein